MINLETDVFVPAFILAIQSRQNAERHKEINLTVR